MSVTFSIRGEKDDDLYLNMSNVNARDLLAWLGYTDRVDLLGELDPRDLEARCKRRLWPERRNTDPSRPAKAYGGVGTGMCRVVECGREEGYLRTRTEQLLRLAQLAVHQQRIIVYG